MPVGRVRRTSFHVFGVPPVLQEDDRDVSRAGGVKDFTDFGDDGQDTGYVAERRERDVSSGAGICVLHVDYEDGGFGGGEEEGFGASGEGNGE